MSPQHLSDYPGLLFWALAWSIIEFEGLAVTWLQVFGIYPGSFGSSGMVWRNLSKDALNSSTLTLFLFLTDCGRALKTLAPWTWKLASLRDWYLPFPWILGTLTSLPLLSEYDSCIPQLGDHPSRIFQMYIARYLSILLSCEYIFSFWSLSQ